MGVGIALMVSAGVAYCAYKYREHCGRYRVHREEGRYGRELDPYDGIYQITTSDFDPTVHVPSDIPLRDREVVRNGFVGPGGDPHRDQPPSYHDWPNKRIGSLLNRTGSDGSREITLDELIEVSMETNNRQTQSSCLTTEHSDSSSDVTTHQAPPSGTITDFAVTQNHKTDSEQNHGNSAFQGISNTSHSEGNLLAQNTPGYDVESKMAESEVKSRGDHVSIISESHGDKMWLITR